MNIRISSNFFLHRKLCYHYFEVKLLPSPAFTWSTALLDCYCLEVILSKLCFGGSTSIVLYEALLLLLREGGGKKKYQKNPKMCYNHYTARWLHLFNMLFLAFVCLLFLSHESCACGVSKRKAKQHFSNSLFLPEHDITFSSHFNLPILNHLVPEDRFMYAYLI